MAQIYRRIFKPDDPDLIFDEAGKLTHFIVCAHCHLGRDEHVDNKCIFDAQDFTPETMSIQDARVLTYQSLDGVIYISVHDQELVGYSSVPLRSREALFAMLNEFL